MNSTDQTPYSDETTEEVSGPVFYRCSFMLPAATAEQVLNLQVALQNATISDLALFSLSPRSNDLVLELCFLTDVEETAMFEGVSAVVKVCKKQGVPVKGVLTTYVPSPDKGLSAAQITEVLKILTSYIKQ